ncbi:CobW family GTP-binding protein [Crocosphaera watsonii]|uniref:COG0523: Putative GTPases (G3E family) n=2 Tax=Crocosphaera watsonii TaxID=263511 RepID=T2JBA1_CROWT|nr:GTP-binding protein [Crocosphaera watsonii]CCQ49304.1 Putative metal chaperone, involved in Zn homeostasis, GTPase of COG0523 family [Crocosphaera watsonii WH 8502]CCQ63143.1 COG0523: Putative GTPases (G3E family) [Crocosphaera watsonii WH 0401]
MTPLNFNLSDALPSLPKSGMPVTIITGFLGSGKTTLLNQILQNKDNLKIAVLVNEFGDINIDEQLLISVESDMIELGNGCICCTINDSFINTVYQVLEREEKIDYLVIETTGLADPFPIIMTFLSTELNFLTRLDAIITVVDAAGFDAKHFDSDAALRQIRYADMVILNKIDLATEDKINKLKAFIKEIKPGFRILESEYSRVPLPLILDIGLTQTDTYKAEIPEFRRNKSAFNNHLEGDGFSFVSFKSDCPFELEKFEHFLSQQLPSNVFRAKGILWFQESPSRHIFQLSGPRYDIQGHDWTTNPKNELVFIGRDLDESLIKQQLNECLVKPNVPHQFSLLNVFSKG